MIEANYEEIPKAQKQRHIYRTPAEIKRIKSETRTPEEKEFLFIVLYVFLSVIFWMLVGICIIFNKEFVDETENSDKKPTFNIDIFWKYQLWVLLFGILYFLMMIALKLLFIKMMR